MDLRGREPLGGRLAGEAVVQVAAEADALRAMTPLLRGTVAAVLDGGLANGMGGCVARGDVGTIVKHLEALDARFPASGALYRELALRNVPLGIERGTTRAHIARAALEAICLQSADVFSAMQADSGIALSELRVDGGATANNLLMQMQADVLGVPVVRPVVTETTALGAAYLAGLAVGVWASGEELAAQWAMDRRFEPVWSDAERRRKQDRWSEAVARSRGWARA